MEELHHTLENRGDLREKLEFIAEANSELRLFLTSFSAKIPGASLSYSSDEGKSCPAFYLPSKSFIFRGIPGAREEALMLDFFLSDITLEKDTSLEKQGLRLFISTHCPHCPALLRLSLDLLKKKDVELEVINVDYCPDFSSEWNIMAVPTLMIKGDELNFRWTGSFNFNELETILEERAPEKLSRESLINIIESGDAQRLVSMMLAEKTIFPAFYSLLLDEKWNIRLGAMVAAESLVFASEELFEVLLEKLWQEKDSMDLRVMGDMIYLMGLGNYKPWHARLEKMLKDSSDSSLKEALEEALEELKTRESS